MTTHAPHKHEFGPREEDLARCVHCGFCLQACPTYVVTGLETESPRGRIALARAVAEGRIEPTPNVIQHFDLCLQCRACETACPSGVPYGRIIESTRALVTQRADRPKSWRVRGFALRQAFAAPWRLRVAFTLLRVYQHTLAPVARRLLPKRLRDMDAMLPPLPSHAYDPPVIACEPAGAVKGTVAMLAGCVMRYTHPRTHEATARVLARNGWRVLVPAEQGCCGALHVHNGDPQAARTLARRNIDAFLNSGADYIVINSAGCGSAMKEYADLFAGDRYAEKAQRFASIVKDVTEFLAEQGFEAPTAPVDARVTYQDSCHLVHAQRIREAPRQVLRAIPGVDLAEMDTPDRCCGAAGIYNLVQPEMSRRLLNDKMDDVLRTNCDVISTANPGCMLQLQLGAKQRKSNTEVVHVIELLDRAYQNEAKS